MNVWKFKEKVKSHFVLPGMWKKTLIDARQHFDRIRQLRKTIFFDVSRVWNIDIMMNGSYIHDVSKINDEAEIL